MMNGNTMHPINNAVRILTPMLDDCGITESPVLLTPDHDLPRCAYERGVPVQVIFGGRSAVIVSEEPVKATTKASFMKDAPLKKPAQRAAAAGILNAVCGFLCKARTLHACMTTDHGPCLVELEKRIQGRQVFCYGQMPDVRKIAGNFLVENPEDADIILIAGDGLAQEDGSAFERLSPDKMLYIGPSTVGTATLLHCDHFCPFGRANIQNPEE